MRTALAVLFLVAIATTTVACVPPGQDVPFEPVLDVETTLDLTAAEDLVLRTEESWCAFWAQAHSAQIEPPPCALDAADFERETILAVAMGGRPSGCFDIWVDRIETGTTPGALTVYVFEQSPDAGCYCTQSITTPAQAVVVANPVGPVDFVREPITLQCE